MSGGLGFRITWYWWILLQAVGVLAIAAVGGPARGLHVGHAPGLGPQRAQHRRRMQGAGAHLDVVGLQDHAPAGSSTRGAQGSVLERQGLGGLHVGTPPAVGSPAPRLKPSVGALALAF